MRTSSLFTKIIYILKRKGRSTHTQPEHLVKYLSIALLEFAKKILSSRSNLNIFKNWFSSSSSIKLMWIELIFRFKSLWILIYKASRIYNSVGALSRATDGRFVSTKKLHPFQHASWWRACDLNYTFHYIYFASSMSVGWKSAILKRPKTVLFSTLRSHICLLNKYQPCERVHIDYMINERMKKKYNK